MIYEDENMEIDFNKAKEVIKNREMTVKEYIEAHPEYDLSIDENLDAMYEKGKEDFINFFSKVDPEKLERNLDFLNADLQAATREDMRRHGWIPEEEDPFLRRYDKQEYEKASHIK